MKNLLIKLTVTNTAVFGIGMALMETALPEIGVLALTMGTSLCASLNIYGKYETNKEEK